MSGGRRQEPQGFRKPSLALLTLLHWGLRLTWAASASQKSHAALINVTVQEPGQGGPRTFLIHHARYGADSIQVEVKGRLLAPQPLQEASNLHGCHPETHFQVPPDVKQWIALLRRGNCTFLEKLSRAAFHNAVGAVIYNNKESVVSMFHRGTENLVAVMIRESEGKELLSYLENNVPVEMTISPQISVPVKRFFEWGPEVFLSISLFIPMAVFLLCLISHAIKWSRR